MLWEGLAGFESLLKKHSRMFLETVEILQQQHGRIVSVLYQQEMHRLALNNLMIKGIEPDADLLCITIEYTSFAFGEQTFIQIVSNLENDQRIYSMRNN